MEETSKEEVIDSKDNFESTVRDLVRSDSRIGWPACKPQYEPLLHGWFFQSHIDVLKLLLDSNTKCIVELGSWLGRSAQYFNRTVPNAIIFALDLWDDNVILNDSHYNSSAENMAILKAGPIYETFLSNMWESRCDILAGELKGIIPMKMDGCEGLELLASWGISPHLIYIDASHHYESVYKDVSTAIRLFPSAHIVGDDWDYKDVRRAVIDVANLSGKEIFEVGYKCWTYSKAECMKERQKRRKQDEMIEEEEKRRIDTQIQNLEFSKAPLKDLLKSYKTMKR